MSVFPIVDRYRLELRALPFGRANGEEMVGLRQRGADGHRSDAIEETLPTPKVEALFAMFLEERVPPNVSGPYLLRYVMERIVPADRALAMRKAI